MHTGQAGADRVEGKEGPGGEREPPTLPAWTGAKASVRLQT